MAIPDFILELRKYVGHAPLWLTGVTAVILDESGANMILQRRADNGEWGPVTGIIDPGEEPAVAAAREAREEADVEIRVERLAEVKVTQEYTYANGDRCRFIDFTFRCRWVSGDPFPADGEATEVAWFPVDALPAMPPHLLERIDAALSPEEAARFVAP